MAFEDCHGLPYQQENDCQVQGQAVRYEEPARRWPPMKTLLGLLLFIVLINDVGFEGQKNNTGDLITSKKNMKTMNEIHLKYVDDLTLAEAINLPASLVEVPDRPQPDIYHARTGHALQVGKSRVLEQLKETQKYSKANDMIINQKKSKLMIFNP